MSSLNEQQFLFEDLAYIKAFAFISATLITFGKCLNIDNNFLLILIFPFLVPLYLEIPTVVLIKIRNFKHIFKNIFPHQKRRRRR
ncbi:hypothetical protein C5S31_01600 [ANME-1 cluster archaeon GoMg2]|nr:hypothetical protein [ANME-1 cluster archaeon GoMg2]